MAERTDKGIFYTTAKLMAVCVAMFAFVFVVMVPLYNVLCDVLGINGKTGGRYEVTETVVDTSRSVKIQFVANFNEQMPWEFKPNTNVVTVHPGEATNITYFARNTQPRDMVAQAIPSVVPSRAAEYFHKTECFCFNRQPLVAGGEADLGLQFIVDPDLPRDIHTITLSYTIFDVTEMAQPQSDSVAAR